MLTTLIADAASTTDIVTNVMPALSSIGSTGFAIWFAYYTTTTTLPTQQKEHREVVDKIVSTHAETIRELVTELKAGREAHDRWRMSGK